jgi:transposase-like protein
VVDHSSISRWAIRFLPLLEKAFRKHKHAVGISWRTNETYIKVNGTWKYPYRAVDRQGQTVDFLLTAKRDAAGPGASSGRLYGTMVCPTR